MMIDDAFSLDDAPPAEPPSAEPPWLAGLNPEQWQAVTTTEGPVLVLSGAGTGKTRVLTTRLAHIIGLGLARPWECLAVTFTNRAAREMRERVMTHVGPAAEQVWLGTFHALGAKMLRRHGDRIGLDRAFTILDTDDQLRLLKPLLADTGSDPKKYPPNAVMGQIQRLKDRGLTPEKCTPEDLTRIAGPRGGGLYAAYQARLRAVNACDFGDLLLHCLTLFQACPDVLAEYQRRFRYILVDEYQDTNVSQYLWLKLLSQGHHNICCVGDDDQSIYAWRGAEVGNILRFEQEFPGARLIRLERNYRSTPPILGAASGLIRHNSGRLGKDLHAANPALGEGAAKVRVQGVESGEAEARWVVDEIESLHRNGLSLSQMAILIRAGHLTRSFEERLILTGTPYRVVGGLRFYERREIRDAVAYLRLIEQPGDDLAFERIINTPKRGLGDAAQQTLHRTAKTLGLPLLAATRALVETDEVPKKARTTLQNFVAMIDGWRAAREQQTVDDLCARVLEETGLLAHWKTSKEPEAEGRVDNLKELVSALEEFHSLEEFLEHVSLVMDNEARAGSGEAVTLMTLHAAKGLEFDAVFLPAWEEDIFPSRRAIDENGLAALEEERRLAYVGLTRARQRAYVSHAASRQVYGDWLPCLPSRFITEIPAEHKEEDTAPGLLPRRGGFTDSWGAWKNEATPGGQGTGSMGSGGMGTGWAARKQAEERAGLTWQRPAASSLTAPSFEVGERVFHEKFGPGTVLAADGDKLTVAFDQAGEKKVMAGFLRGG